MAEVEPVTLGEHYRDSASGFSGVAEARAVYRHANTEVLVIAETRQAAADSRWIPEGRLVPVPSGSTGFHP